MSVPLLSQLDAGMAHRPSSVLRDTGSGDREYPAHSLSVRGPPAGAGYRL